MKIFYLPDLGEGLAEAEIREWYVKEGDIVQVDQPLVSMETAKAVVDVPSPSTGKIARLHGKSGDIIPTGSPLVEFEKGEKEKDRGTVVGNLEESSQLIDEGDMIIGAAKRTESNRVKAMPAVRTLAKQLHVDLSLVKGTGPQGQITAEDVKRYSEKNPEEKTGSVETLHGVRRAMAVAMSQSHLDIVPVTLMDDADISNFTSDADLTVSVLQAIIEGVKAEPTLNAWFDGKTLERCTLEQINVGIAMDTKEGLFVPVIKDIQTLTAKQLREKINTYKISVGDRSIPPSDLQGASITLSNFGMFAGRYASPIIVPPQVAILGVGKIRDAVLPIEGKIQIRRIMPLSLSFDHRAVTGGEASRFLAAIIKYLEKK